MVDGQRWWFDTKAFDEVRGMPMGDTGYGKLPSLEIDFSSAISVELKKMLSKKAVDSVGSYFDEISRYAERQLQPGRFQAPPRIIRSLPREGPFGSSLGLFP